jgi:hypothetical protein
MNIQEQITDLTACISCSADDETVPMQTVVFKNT